MGTEPYHCAFIIQIEQKNLLYQYASRRYRSNEQKRMHKKIELSNKEERLQQMRFLA